MFKVEYDGKPIKSGKSDRIKLCTPKGRRAGYYVIFPDGHEEQLHIGYLRVSEMKNVTKLLNKARNLEAASEKHSDCIPERPSNPISQGQATEDGGLGSDRERNSNP